MAERFDIESIRQRLKAEGPGIGWQVSNGPTAAVAIVIDADGGSILLIRRRDLEGDPWSGQIAFPGGRKSSLDQSLLETAIRETAEEVGVELKNQTMLGALPPVQSLSRKVLVAPFVFLLQNEVGLRLNEEVAETFWASLGKLAKLKQTPTSVVVQEGRLQVNSYIYDGHTIWGLTFRIINMLLGRS